MTCIKLLLCTLSLFFLLSLQAVDEWTRIQASGTLRVLINDNSETRGFDRSISPEDYERGMLLAFAEEHGLKVKFIMIQNLSTVFKYLGNSGDLAASTLAETPERRAKYALSHPYAYTREQIVVSTKKSRVKGISDLRGLTGRVLPGTTYRDTLQQFLKENPSLRGKELPQSMSSGELLSRVAEGIFDYTILDDNYIDSYLSAHDDVKVIHTFPKQNPLVYVMPKTSVSLQKKLNEFIQKNTLNNQYFTHKEDLPSIRKRKMLRVLTRNNPFCYFLHRGTPMGFEYEMVQMFAKEQGLLMVMIVPPRWSDMEKLLAEGKADMIAANFTPTEARRGTMRDVLFSENYAGATQVIVGWRGETASSIHQLKGRTVYARRNSAFWNTLEALRAEAGFQLRALPDDMETYVILDQVALGKYDLAAADDIQVNLLIADGMPIRTVCPISRKQGFSWVFRKNNPLLKNAADDFFRKKKRSAEYNILYQRYYTAAKPKMRKEALDVKNPKISPYDTIFMKYALKYNLHWCLLSAQAFQESRFDPNAKNYLGARGLMQVMPKTLRELGFREEEAHHPDTGIHAGAMYLQKQAARFPAHIDPVTRWCFALASYNAGYGHVADARELAEKLGLSKDHWFYNVEKAMSLLSQQEYARKAKYGYCRSSETIPYVNNILIRLKLYADYMSETLPPVKKPPEPKAIQTRVR